MTDTDWRIPPSTLAQLAALPADRPVALLLRHSVRDALPPGPAGDRLPITAVGHALARRLGELLGDRLVALHSSPLPRCVQTAAALAEGACSALSPQRSRLLGDPGVFVLDAEVAGANWERLGHEGVMARLVTDGPALPGMAQPAVAARALVRHLIQASGEQAGVHVFVTHDSLITATAAHLLGRALGVEDWPCFLEGALVWVEEAGVHVRYRDWRVVLGPSSG